MKVYYHQLSPGEMPIFGGIKSRAVHIWIPRSWPGKLSGGHGWIRQQNPVNHKNPLPDDPFRIKDLNGVVPLFELRRKGFAAWLRARVRQLGVTKGSLFVVIRDSGDDWLNAGVLHDSRPCVEVCEGYEDLPTDLDLQERRQKARRTPAVRRTVERRQKSEEPERLKRQPKVRRTKKRRYHERRKG